MLSSQYLLRSTAILAKYAIVAESDILLITISWWTDYTGIH